MAVAGTVSVVSVEGGTELQPYPDASPNSGGEGRRSSQIATPPEDPLRSLPLEERRTKSVGTGLKRKATDILSLPSFRRGFVWTDSSMDNVSPSALYTLTAPPLPDPPCHLVDDPKIQAALQAYKEHIRVETPFKVDKLESMLLSHPNRPFVESVMKGLREGFWPLDGGEWKFEREEVLENYATEEKDLEAIRKFKERECTAGRWSSEVSHLLPGVKVSPLFVVWQNEKPRVVNDHAASGLNDGIPREEAKVRYDDMHSFGQSLNNARRSHRGRTLVTFKDDVEKAFLNVPAHPIWQLRQFVRVDGKLYVVRRLVFGSRASPRIWCAVSGLICWLGIYKLGIPDLHVYMDDFFGWDFADNLVRYRGEQRPKRQVQLLLFWEAIGCPFDDEKQLWGPILKIIGFQVDINAGKISIMPGTIDDIVAKAQKFLATTGRSPPLREWWRLAGHLNWLLNVLPWGRPALTEMYRKMGGKAHASSGVPINAEVRRDLGWLMETVPKAIGVRFTDEGRWEDREADFVVWTDASLRMALSFVFAGNGYVYQLKPPPPNVPVDIFFLELVAILSAVHHAATMRSPPRRMLLWTDSLDAVGVFNTLRANESLHNGALLGVASLILRTGIDLRVRFIPGKENVGADLLSRLMFDDFRRQFPTYRVRAFEPARELLPTRWRTCF
jgi:hypothetical protein